MSLDGELLLDGDVEVRAVAELPPDLRARIRADDGDFAITRRRSRTLSRIVDRDSADLLVHFRTPTRLVDAVIAFAAARGLDPRETLERSFPLLLRLHQARLLVTPGARALSVARRELGDVVAGFRLVRSIQALDGDEVFIGRDEQGRYAAVKDLGTATEERRALAANEAAALERAAGLAPQLFTAIDEGASFTLVTEWIFGDDAIKAAADARAAGQDSAAALAARVASTFAELHERGVLHGDVHPRNVVVEEGGGIRLLDFGLARIAGATFVPPRGGVAFYYDPELAAALARGADAELTAPSEQYAVAALVYQMVVGTPYLDWKLGRDEMLGQVLDAPPLSFKARRIAPWPELEEVVARALDKRPERRFASMRAFAEALAAAGRTARISPAPIATTSTGADELTQAMLRRVDYDGGVFRDGPRDAPLASLNYGAGGIGYALLRLARRRRDPRLLALADVWATKAFALAGDERAFFNDDLDVRPETVGEVSLFHSSTGLACLRALVSIDQGDIGTAGVALGRFVAASRGPNRHDDLTLGSGSLLLGAAELLESASDAAGIDLAPLRLRGDEIALGLDVILERAIGATDGFATLGIAHGVAGVLFARLRWSKATGAACPPVVAERLADLAALAEPYGAGLRWRIELDREPASFLEGWCNGTAGHVMLFALASEVLGAPALAAIAERAAADVWSSDSTLGTLCCGLAGMSYALLAVHRLTGAGIWLDRARIFADRAAADTSPSTLRDALYKGSVGAAVLADELHEPETASMPLFEPLR